MVEKQEDHRHRLEARVVGAEVSRSLQGLVAGVIVVLGFEVLAAMIITQGHSYQGAILGGVPLVALAGVFVYGTRSRRQEREQKARIMTNQLRLPLDDDSSRS